MKHSLKTYAACGALLLPLSLVLPGCGGGSSGPIVNPTATATSTTPTATSTTPTATSTTPTATATTKPTATATAKPTPTATRVPPVVNSPFAGTYAGIVVIPGADSSLSFIVASNGSAKGDFRYNGPVVSVLAGTVDAQGNVNLKNTSGSTTTVTGKITDTSGAKVAAGTIDLGYRTVNFSVPLIPTIAAGTGKVQLTLGAGNPYSASNGTGTRSVNSSTGATFFFLSAGRIRSDGNGGSSSDNISISLAKSSTIQVGDTFVAQTRDATGGIGINGVGVNHYQRKSMSIFVSEDSMTSNPPGTVKVTAVSPTSISLRLSNVSMQVPSIAGIPGGNFGNIGSATPYLLNGTFNATNIQTN